MKTELDEYLVGGKIIITAGEQMHASMKDLKQLPFLQGRGMEPFLIEQKQTEDILSDLCAGFIASFKKGDPINQAPGFTYVARYRNCPDLYKIGTTKNDPLRRMRELSKDTSAPENLELLMTVQCHEAGSLEKCLHQILHEKCAKGEWFNLSLTELIRRLATATYSLRILGIEADAFASDQIVKAADFELSEILIAAGLKYCSEGSPILVPASYLSNPRDAENLADQVIQTQYPEHHDCSQDDYANSHLRSLRIEPENLLERYILLGKEVERLHALGTNYRNIEEQHSISHVTRRVWTMSYKNRDRLRAHFQNQPLSFDSIRAFLLENPKINPRKNMVSKVRPWKASS